MNKSSWKKIAIQVVAMLGGVGDFLSRTAYSERDNHCRREL